MNNQYVKDNEEKVIDLFKRMNDAPIEISEHLKPAINNLLWVYLPSNIKLRRAEEIACEIYNDIYDEWTNDNTH